MHALALTSIAPADRLGPPRQLKPIIKWAGGKTKLLPELVARMPSFYGRYYEPFAGSASLFLHLAPKQAVLADTNEDLIETYRTIVEDIDAVVVDLEWFQRLHDEAFYYETRERWNQGFEIWRQAERAAAFLYLNKTCFNGLWRVNAKGEFNVPMGDYKKPKILDEPVLRAAASSFARATLRVADFREAVTDARKGDFVYFDPPYIPSSPTASFTSYTVEGFGEAQHRALAALFKRLVREGVRVMLSNSDTPLSRELYRGYHIECVSRSGMMNSDPTKRGRVGELIVTGGY